MHNACTLQKNLIPGPPVPPFPTRPREVRCVCMCVYVWTAVFSPESNLPFSFILPLFHPPRER